MKQVFKSLAFAAVVVTIALGAPTITQAKALSKKQAVKEISKSFAASPSMAGEFIQFNPNGEQTGGKFYIVRPGKIRLDYEDPSPLYVVSNGRTLAVNNSKLKTWNYYPLSKTPLKLLLSKKLKVNSKSIKSVEVGDDITTVVMGDKKIFGNSEITMLFDPATHDLRQWTIKDAQGKETSVMIFNVRKNVKISSSAFVVNQHNKNDR